MEKEREREREIWVPSAYCFGVGIGGDVAAVQLEDTRLTSTLKGFLKNKRELYLKQPLARPQRKIVVAHT